MLVATLPRNRIKDILTLRGLTIQEMARSADMSYTTAHNIATSTQIPDNVRYGTIKKIAKVLGVEINELEEEIQQ